MAFRGSRSSPSRRRALWTSHGGGEPVADRQRAQDERAVRSRWASATARLTSAGSSAAPAAPPAVRLRGPRRGVRGAARVGPVPVAVGQGRLRQAVRRRLRRRSAAVAPAGRRGRCACGTPTARRPAWSAPAAFETGLLQQSDWGSAKWIELAGRTNAQPLPIFARGFSRRQDRQERAPVHERPRPLRGADQRRPSSPTRCSRPATRTTSSPPSTAPTTSRASCAAARTRSASSSARARRTTSRWPTRPSEADELVRVVEQHRGRQRHADGAGGGRRHQRQRLQRRELLPRRHDQHRHRRRRRPARVAHDHRDRHRAGEHDARRSRRRRATPTSRSTASPAWPSAAS